MEELEKQFTEEIRGLIERLIEESNKQVNDENAYIDSRNPVERPETYENSEYGEMLQQLHESRGYTERRELIAKIQKMEKNNIRKIKMQITKTKNKFLEDYKAQSKAKIEVLEHKKSNIDSRMNELAKKVNNIMKVSGSLSGEKEVYKLAQTKKKEHIKGIKGLLKQREQLQAQIKEIEANVEEVNNKYKNLTIRSVKDAYELLNQLEGRQDEELIQENSEKEEVKNEENTRKEDTENELEEPTIAQEEEHQEEAKTAQEEKSQVEPATEENQNSPKETRFDPNASKFAVFAQEMAKKDGIAKENKPETKKNVEQVVETNEQKQTAEPKNKNNVKVIYNARTDSYLIKDLVTKESRIAARRELGEITEDDIMYLEEKLGTSLDDIQNIDNNILDLLMDYDYKNGDTKAIEYLRMLSRTENEQLKNQIQIEYNLKTLYDRNPLSDKLQRKILSYSEIRNMLDIANNAKQRGFAKVTKGVKVTLWEYIDKLVERFPKRKALSASDAAEEKNVQEVSDALAENGLEEIDLEEMKPRNSFKTKRKGFLNSNRSKNANGVTISGTTVQEAQRENGEEQR